MTKIDKTIFKDKAILKNEVTKKLKIELFKNELWVSNG